MSLRTAFRLVVAAAIGACSSAQDVIVVDAAGGAGSDYTDLKEALNAANDHDILLVRDGSYLAYPRLFLKKNLTVVAEHAHAADALLTVCLENDGIQCTLDWRGVDVRHFNDLVVAVGGNDHARFEDVAFRGVSPITLAVVNDVGDLSLARCDLPAVQLSITGSALIFSNGGRISLYDSHLGGSDVVQPSPAGTPAAGGSVLQLTTVASGPNALSVFASGCRLEGGAGDDGWSKQHACANGGAGGDVVRFPQGKANQSIALVDCVLAPGHGGAAASPCGPGADGNAISDASGLVKQTFYAGRARSLNATSPVREGETLKLKCSGETGDLVVIHVSLGAAYAGPAGGIGPSLLAFPMRTFALGTLPGAATTSLKVSELGAGIEGVALRLQAAFVDANGQVRLSNPSTTVLLDAGI